MANSMERFATQIERQRLSPRITDFAYIHFRNNLRVFREFLQIALSSSVTKLRVLDLGCGFKPWKPFFPHAEYVGVDYSSTCSSADALGLADNLPFRDGSFDAVILSEVIEHTVDPNAVLRETRRVVKSGGVVFISSPFFFPEHGAPFDFFRPTKHLYIRMFSQDEILVLSEANSSFSTPLVALCLAVESSPFRLLRGLTHLLYACANLVACAIDRAIAFFGPKVMRTYRTYFYGMPVGIALTVRVRKQGSGAGGPNAN